MLDPLAKEFRITHMEMIKGIQGHGYYDELVVPIIENTAHERELTASLAAAVYIYSSGSRLAQRLLFGHTNYGDLRNYLCGFFDTTVGNKKESKSYVEISESLGVHKPSEILFVTDIFQESVAAKAADRKKKKEERHFTCCTGCCDSWWC